MKSKNSFSGLFGDLESPEGVRRQFIETPLDASVPNAMNSVLELAKVLTTIPDAFIASQKRELQRVKDSSGAHPERIEALQASIDQAETFRTTAKNGEARVQRLALAVLAGQQVFHGFVSAGDLTPMAGATVRLSGRKARGRKDSVTTDEDGYFSIPLEASSKREGQKKRDLSISQQINRMFEARSLDISGSADTSKAEAEQQQAEEATVEILVKGRLVHEDPIPLVTDDGTAYREYVVTEAGSSSSGKYGSQFESTLFWEDAAQEVDTSQMESGTKKKAPKK